MDLFSTKIAYAAGTSVDDFIHKVDASIINPLIYLLFALAILFFLYGVLEFLLNQENEEKKTTGKSHMVWGIIGITIMLGVWAIMGLILNTLGINYIHPQQGTVDSQSIK
ncbi:MAG: hypothetical protein KGL67_02820 [Patescibacteria group bacterium]|nr:hypothetical protein [Patescibacteria group bacterium]